MCLEKKIIPFGWHRVQNSLCKINLFESISFGSLLPIYCAAHGMPYRDATMLTYVSGAGNPREFERFIFYSIFVSPPENVDWFNLIERHREWMCGALLWRAIDCDNHDRSCKICRVSSYSFFLFATQYRVPISNERKPNNKPNWDSIGSFRFFLSQFRQSVAPPRRTR